jgi:hypothetical protein
MNTELNKRRGPEWAGKTINNSAGTASELLFAGYSVE